MALAGAIASERLSVAPMTAYTSAEFRYLCRLLNRQASLYTELILDRHLLSQQPLERRPSLKHNCAAEVAHLGGCSTDLMVTSAKLIEQAGFREININAESLNPNRKDKRFGVSLMLDPEFDTLVKSVCSSVDVPVSVMCRTGVDEHDSFEFLRDFSACMLESGVKHVIVTAQHALLSEEKRPAALRSLKPYEYETVYRLKKEFGDSLKVTLNGGVKTADEIRTHLRGVDGVMIGRAIRANPFLLRELDDSHPDRRPNNEWFKERRCVVQHYTAFTAELELQSPRRKMPIVLKPLQNLFYGTTLSNIWKKALRTGSSYKTPTEGIPKALEIIDEAMIDPSMRHEQTVDIDEHLRKLERIFQM